MERSDDKDHKLVTVSSSEVGSPIEKDGSISPFSSREEFISENVAPPAPDGGRRAWLVVLGGWLNFTASFGIVNAFGTFESVYETDLHMSTSLVTWIGSAQMFVLFVGGIIVGPIFDKWGARIPMLMGTFLCLVSFLSCSFSTKFYQLLLAQGFTLGLGCALLFYPTTSAVSEWFDKRRGLALGLVVSGASAGGILWPLVLNQLIDKIGINGTHRATGVIAAPLMLTSCFLVKERKLTNSANDDSEAKVPPAPVQQTSLAATILDVRFLALSLGLLFINGGMMVPFFYIPQYAIDHGVSPTMANNMLAITYVASLCGRILSGWVADQIGRFNMLICISTLTGIATLCWMQTSTLPAMMTVSLLFGFSSGGIVPLGSACVAQTTPASMGRIGLRIGAMMAICSVGTLASGPISGTIRDQTHQWWGVLVSQKRFLSVF
ncbi:hypothetical protein NQ176_g2731 [Zarea fungicola]|uniref:Uncharacterized protein n=1 Tax=Zarea fungicola TaxID=93591 RepID=A0ACC1NPE6_9HYPO|nr:hypothetical protein NQ176_g2731 [Lecanicillium fungicola]